MHGRLQAARLGEGARLGEPEHRQAVPWAQRVPEVVRPESRGLGVELAQAIDTETAGLARGQAERPEPWVLATLGPYPIDGSAKLQADWLARVGDAAGYRQAAGLTDPNMVVGPAPQAHPELLTWHAQVVLELEIQSPDAMIWAMTPGQLEAKVAEYNRLKATAPPEVSPELKAERLAEADARARSAELSALGQHEAAQKAQARADAADVRATVLEGQAEVHAQWEDGTAADRRLAEQAKAELERRVAAEQDARAQAEAAAVRGSGTPEVPDMASTTPDLGEPSAAAGYRPGIEDPDAAAEALVASLDQVELPEPDTSSPIEDPELSAVAQEMATRSQAREVAAEARQQQMAEAQADQAQRAAMREAAARDVEMHSPEAWVSGPRTPSWGGPEASAAEATAAAELGGPEAAL